MFHVKPAMEDMGPFLGEVRMIVETLRPDYRGRFLWASMSAEERTTVREMLEREHETVCLAYIDVVPGHQCDFPQRRCYR